VMVEIPEECSESAFVAILASRLGVDPAATGQLEPRDQFETIMGWFEEVASTLRDEGLVTTLVVDDMNFLAKQAPALVPALQHWFKRLATKRIAACVGVVSEPWFVYQSFSAGGTEFPPLLSDNRCELAYVGELDRKGAKELVLMFCLLFHMLWCCHATG